MRLTGLQLRNVTCFEDIDLQFTDLKTGKPSRWVVLLGENGTGKSTILQMLGAALLGPAGLATVGGDIDWRGYVRIGQEDSGGEIRITLRTDASDANFSGEPQNFVQTVSLGNARQYGIQMGFIGYVESMQDQFPGPLYSGSTEGGWFACGYSPWRRTTRRSESALGAFPTLRESDKAYRFATLFGDERALTSARDWLSNLFFRSIHPDHDDTDVKRFESAISAIEKTLPSVKYDSITPDKEVWFVESGTRVPLGRLSDGYSSTLAWITDLIRRLWDAFPKDPLNASGVVLIDEIDLHLHPRWQREVVERTRKLFPNIQFIVTTHSPFVAQDMRAGDTLIVLKRENKIRGHKNVPIPVRAEQGRGFAKGWRADQILTSYLFGLEGTRNQSVLKDESEYENLLDAEASNGLTEKRRSRLEVLQRRLQRVLSAPGESPDEREIYQAANDVIESLSGVRVPSREEAEKLPDDDEDLLLSTESGNHQ